MVIDILKEQPAHATFEMAKEKLASAVVSQSAGTLNLL